MGSFDDLLAANRAFAETFQDGNFDGVAHAGVAIVTCMDSRIDPLRLVGLDHGDAKIFRNPGGRVTDQALEALVLAVHLLAASFWLGGMAFMLWIAPPALAARLPPEQQGPLRLALLGRFLAAVWIAMPLTLASGYALFALTGERHRRLPLMPVAKS